MFFSGIVYIELYNTIFGRLEKIGLDFLSNVEAFKDCSKLLSVIEILRKIFSKLEVFMYKVLARLFTNCSTYN